MPDDLRARLPALVAALEMQGYRALPCATCGRAGVVRVHDLHELLAALLREPPEAATELDGPAGGAQKDARDSVPSKAPALDASSLRARLWRFLEALRASLRSRRLFNEHDEPLDDAGLRIVRVIAMRLQFQLDATDVFLREPPAADARHTTAPAVADDVWGHYAALFHALVRLEQEWRHHGGATRSVADRLADLLDRHAWPGAARPAGPEEHAP